MHCMNVLKTTTHLTLVEVNVKGRDACSEA